MPRSSTAKDDISISKAKSFVANPLFISLSTSLLVVLLKAPQKAD